MSNQHNKGISRRSLIKGAGAAAGNRPLAETVVEVCAGQTVVPSGAEVVVTAVQGRRVSVAPVES